VADKRYKLLKRGLPGTPGFGLGDLDDGETIEWQEPPGVWQAVPRHQLAEANPTGLVNGGELNIGPGPNDVEVIAGNGIIVDSYTNPVQPPVISTVAWAQINDPITAAPAVAGSIVYLTMDGTGTLQQYPTAPTEPTRRDEIFLGALIHNGSTWGEVSSPIVVNNAAHSLAEFLKRVAGPTFVIDGGNALEAPAFTIDQDAGTLWEHNRNWHVDKKDPHREALPPTTGLQWRTTNRDFSSVGILTGTVDPTLYDDAGLVVAVPGGVNTATIQQLYQDPRDNYWLLWGQQIFDSATEAAASISAVTEVPALLQTSVLLAYIVVEKGQNDWDVDEAFIVYPQGGGGVGGGGVPITNHDDLIGITPDNHHNQVHLWWGTDHSDMSVSTPVETQGAFLNGAEFIPDYRSKYIATYAEGPTYYPQQWANNSSWIAIANTETTEPAFPVLVGDPQFIYPAVPPFLETDHVGQVRSGYGTTFTQNGEVSALAVWIPEVTNDTNYTFVIVADPNGAPQLDRFPLRNETLTAGEWNIVTAGLTVVTIGAEYLMYLESHNFGGTTVVTGGWAYEGKQNTAAPPDQNWNTNIAQNILRIDKQDLNATDRTSELLGIIIGSTILFAETAAPENTQAYIALADPVDSDPGQPTGYISWIVSLSSETGEILQGVTTTMTADVPIAQATKFVYETDKFLVDPAFAAVDSFLQYDGVDQPVSPDIGYGINFDFQQLNQSTDWDLIAIGSGGGGGGDFTPETFLGAGTTGYVPDPVTEEEKFLRDDGTWQEAGGGGSTESDINQVAHGFAPLDAVRFNGFSWVKAQANDISTTALGLVVAVADNDNFTFAMSGRYAIGALTSDEWYYLSDTVAGGLTPTEPGISQPIVYAEDSTNILIYPYRPSFISSPIAPIIGEVKAVTSVAALPFGWHLADGTNGTIDLRGKAIFADGANGITAGVDGGALPVGGTSGTDGAHTHTLTMAAVANHNHGNTSTTGSHLHVGSLADTAFTGVTVNSGGGATTLQNTSGAIPAGNHTHGISDPKHGHGLFIQGDGDHAHTTGTAGGHTPTGSANSNGDHTHTTPAGTLPPYRGMFLIQYTGVA
jgi:hypothetical protein